MLVSEMRNASTTDNIVFPLFGATDQEQSYFLPNELARSFADKIGARVKYAWFPYRPDSMEDCELFKNTSYNAQDIQYNRKQFKITHKSALFYRGISYVLHL